MKTCIIALLFAITLRAADNEYVIDVEKLTGNDAITIPSDARGFINEIKNRGLLDDVVMILVRGGTVCQYIGHDWEETYMSFGIGEATYSRKCMMCGKTQTREMSDWK